MAWFEKPKYVVKKNLHANINAGLWRKCISCNAIIYNKEWEEDFHVCAHCGFHDKLTGVERIQTLIDPGTFIETNTNLLTGNPLDFKDYREKIKQQMAKTKMKEAVITGYGKLDGRMIDIAVMDFAFLGASMGSVVGEKVTLAIESALSNKRPLVIVSASGGARMQEGILSLMQMAKTSAALKRLSMAGGLYISVLTDPTMAGVSASFAMLGDFNIAEKNALIGFAGARVIEGTIKQKLPPGFQRAEFLADHGFIDIVTERKNLKTIISNIIRYTME
jgi:acetyl-CoA carboxylase carboxyl transferase subunit beta